MYTCLGDTGDSSESLGLDDQLYGYHKKSQTE